MIRVMNSILYAAEDVETCRFCHSTWFVWRSVVTTLAVKGVGEWIGVGGSVSSARVHRASRADF